MVGKYCRGQNYRDWRPIWFPAGVPLRQGVISHTAWGWPFQPWAELKPTSSVSSEAVMGRDLSEVGGTVGGHGGVLH